MRFYRLFHFFFFFLTVQIIWIMCLMCFPAGIGPVHMNEVQCSGFEKSLTECHFNRDALGCSHEEDAAVKCNVPDMGFNNRVSGLFYTAKTK